jgi:transcriptional regulator with XRE-family HTH domain
MLAEKSGVSVVTISTFETGQRNPYGVSLRALEAALVEGGIVMMKGGGIRPKKSLRKRG